MTEQQAIRARQKRLVIIALVIAALWAVGVVIVLQLLPDGQAAEPAEPVSRAELAEYVEAQWSGYQLLDYDEASQTVEVRGQSSVRYNQAQKYGAESYGPMLESYVDTAKAIAAGLRLDCGLDSPQVVLHQYSSDDQVILTAASDGTVETCWES